MALTNINVLITHVSYQASGSFIKMLRKSKKYNVYIVGCDSIPKGYSSGSILVDRFYKVPSNLNSDLYIEHITKICNGNNIDIILSAEEEDLILFKQTKLPQIKNEYISNKNVFDLFKDKHKANLKMKRENIIVPKTIYNRLEFDKSLSKKFIQRERVSCSSRGIKIFNKDDIDLDYTFYTNKYITQEFIEGKMFTVDVICDKKGVPSVIVPRQSLSIKDGTTFKCIFDNNIDIIDICKRIYSMHYIPGISNVQFIVKEETPYFIELNPRAAATIIASSLVSVNLLDIYISHFYFDEPIIDLEEFIKLVHWNSVISRYYQETIY